MRSFRSSKKAMNEVVTRNHLFFSSSSVRTLTYPNYRNSYIHHGQYRNQYSELDELKAEVEKLKRARARVLGEANELQMKIDAVQNKIENKQNCAAQITESWINKILGKDASTIQRLIDKLTSLDLGDVMEAAIKSGNETAIGIITDSKNCDLRPHLAHCIHTFNERKAFLLVSKMNRDELTRGAVDWDGFVTTVPMLSVAAEVYMSLAREGGKVDISDKQDILLRIMTALLEKGASVHDDCGASYLGKNYYSVFKITEKFPELRKVLLEKEDYFRQEEKLSLRKV